VALQFRRICYNGRKEAIDPLYSQTFEYEVDKEALKPTINSSEINLDPVSKRSLSKKS
jgi:hypothetical protein